MNEQKKVLSNGWVVTLKYTMRHKLRRDVFYERLVLRQQKRLTEFQENYRNIFSWCAGHTEKVELGKAWQPPPETASEGELETSFNLWVDEVKDEQIAAEWYEAVFRMSLPLAPPEQQSQAGVSEEIKADPNSSSGGRISRRKSKKTSDESPAAS